MNATPTVLLAELANLQRDDDPRARSIGAALTAAALDGLRAEERRWIGDIETMRAELEAAREEVDVALPNSRGVVKMAEIGATCRLRSKKPAWGVFLLTLARTLAPGRCIELGTCLGISTSFLSAGMRLAGRGRLVTMEGATALAERSAKNLASLGLDNVEVVPGLFVDTLAPVLEAGGPVDLCFVDGHHQEAPTLAYFDRISEHLADPAVVVFDDISWSEGMVRAWVAIRADRRVRVAVDLGSVGVCVVGPPTDEPARHYRFPTVTAMRQVLIGLAGAEAARLQPDDDGVARLCWTTAPSPPSGWLTPGTDVRHGLPMDDGRLDYAVSVHTLSTLPLTDVAGVLLELHRVLRPGGTLRIEVPDFLRTLAAFTAGDPDAFVVSDRHAGTLSGKFVTEALWYGLSASLFTEEFLGELLGRAGFTAVRRCAYGETASGPAAITELDERPESLFMEAVR